MSLLQQYEEQYAALIAEITADIGQLQQHAAQRDLPQKIDGNLAEASELLEQMSLEVRDLHVTQRANFNSKISCAQVELQRLQKDYKAAKDAQRNSKQVTLDMHAAVIVGAHNEADFFEDVNIENEQRQRLLENSERIERTGNRLTDGYRIALETETIGAQVLQDLHQQRETLQGARSRLRETNADLGRASRTLNSMMLRAMREKAVLYVVGVCFVLAVGLSLYLTFSSSATQTA